VQSTDFTDLGAPVPTSRLCDHFSATC